MRLISEAPHSTTLYGCPYQSLNFELDDGRVLHVSGALYTGTTWVARFGWDKGEEGYAPVGFAYVPALDDTTRFYADLLAAQDHWRPILTALDTTITPDQLAI